MGFSIGEYSVLSEFSPDTKRRFRLECRWDRDNPKRYVWIMLNPSIAGSGNTPDDLDPTLRRVRGFTQRDKRAGGFVVFNLFSIVSTDPKALEDQPREPDPIDQTCIAEAATGGENVLRTIAAWGANRHVTERTDLFRRRAMFYRTEVHCLGKTKAQHPKHPLYLPSATPWERF